MRCWQSACTDEAKWREIERDKVSQLNELLLAERWGFQRGEGRMTRGSSLMLLQFPPVYKKRKEMEREQERGRREEGEMVRGQE